MQLNLLVLRCKNIVISKNFYEKLLGLKFIKEQHGKGAVHFSAYVGKTVLELYPLTKSEEVENIRLGFTLELEDVENHLKEMQIEILSRYEFEGKMVFVVGDLEGRKIELIREEHTE